MPYPLLHLEFLVAVLRVVFAGQTDAHQSFAAGSVFEGCYLEQSTPQSHRIKRQCQYDLFLVWEVVVDRSFGVLHLRRNAIHRQGVQPLSQQNRLGHPKDFPSALLDFPLFSR